MVGPRVFHSENSVKKKAIAKEEGDGETFNNIQNVILAKHEY
jgi:hypothetical protein